MVTPDSSPAAHHSRETPSGDEQPINPKYYERMSELLDTLIQQRKQEALAYEQYLAKIVELTSQIQNPAGATTYPQPLDTRAKRALFDNLGKDENLAVALDDEIRATKKDGWRGSKIKEREVRYAIRKHVRDAAEIERILDLVRNQSDY